MECRKHHKRLCPWLRQKVEAGEFHLKWIDRDKQIFSIPWPHRKNIKVWNEERCQVFREWAKLTNRYEEGDPEDWAVWKTRLRTSLDKLKSDFERLAHLDSKNPKDPYRVYRFVVGSTQKKLASRNVKNSPSRAQETDRDDVHPCGNIPNFVEHFDGHLSSQSNPHLESQNVNDIEGTSTVNDENLLDFAGLNSETLVVKSVLSSEEMDCYLLLPKVEFVLYYFNIVVEQGVLHRESVHFYFGDKPNHIDSEKKQLIFGPNDSSEVKFPDLPNLSDPEAISPTQWERLSQILSRMRRGFHLEYREKDIYIQRCCRSRIFAKSDFLKKKKVERSTIRTKLFDWKSFIESPHLSPNLILTFAEDPCENLAGQTMHMELIHIAAKAHQQHLSPPSLRSLLISSKDYEDKLLEQMKAVDLNKEESMQ